MSWFKFGLCALVLSLVFVINARAQGSAGGTYVAQGSAGGTYVAVERVSLRDRLHSRLHRAEGSSSGTYTVHRHVHRSYGSAGGTWVEAPRRASKCTCENCTCPNCDCGNNQPVGKPEPPKDAVKK